MYTSSKCSKFGVWGYVKRARGVFARAESKNIGCRIRKVKDEKRKPNGGATVGMAGWLADDSV
jgi:hypothetical protein